MMMMQGQPMQMQPMMMAPGAMAPAGYAVIPLLAPDIMSTLDRLKGVFINQRIDVLEVVTGCEGRNKYILSAWDPVLGEAQPKQGKGDELMKFKEESDCCIRLLCGPARPFQMALFADSPSIGTYRKGPDPLTLPDAIILERPFKCTFLCLARPIIKIKHNSLGCECWGLEGEPAGKNAPNGIL